MEIKVFPGRLTGTVDAPPSASVAHRAILCAMLAEGDSTLSNLELSDEIQATINGAKALYNDGLTVDCRESTGTLRFLMVLLAAVGRKTTFLGGPSLAEKPLQPLIDLLTEHGVTCTTEGAAHGWFPLTIEGKLQGKRFLVRGDVGSRFISGLMMALPLLGAGAEIVLTSPLQTRDYSNLTMEVMRRFGVTLTATENGWKMEKEADYQPAQLEIEGGYAGAVYYLCANRLPRTNVTVTGLSAASRQPDRAISNIIPALGNGLEVDVKEIPDSVPALAMTAAHAEGRTSFFNAGRYEYEAKRMQLLCQNILSMGGQADIEDDRLIVYGKQNLSGGCVIPTGGDYRIAMATMIGALACLKPVVIQDAEAINHFYPNFFKDFARLGGVCEIISPSKAGKKKG
ncbi:MAG TPA: hypothetical protein GX726_04330 [Clostridiales bacterium]|jgi:3-phosphoshikimate 1-carboxyvinyltransferase|nr:hypothetical protein [Clostridiales bacterium]